MGVQSSVNQILGVVAVPKVLEKTQTKSNIATQEQLDAKEVHALGESIKRADKQVKYTLGGRELNSLSSEELLQIQSLNNYKMQALSQQQGYFIKNKRPLDYSINDRHMQHAAELNNEIADLREAAMEKEKKAREESMNMRRAQRDTISQREEVLKSYE